MRLFSAHRPTDRAPVFGTGIAGSIPAGRNCIMNTCLSTGSASLEITSLGNGFHPEAKAFLSRCRG